MKKRLLTAITAALLLFSLGTVALADDENPIPPAEVNAEYIPGEAPAESDVSSMTPALHAVLLAMENQGVSSFTTDNNVLSWEMLYNLLSMYGQMDDRASFEDEVLVLPSETVMDYSAALFDAPPSPESLPEEVADRITYSAASDEYRLYCGSDGLSQVVIDRAIDFGSSVELSGRLVYLAEEENLASFTTKLTVCDNLFGYTLTELNIV